MGGGSQGDDAMTLLKTISARFGPWLLFFLPPLIVVFIFGDWTALGNIRCWFDPILLQYNALMGVAAILFPPMITFIYIREMGAEKQRRIRRDLDDHAWQRYEQRIVDRVNHEFRFRSYFGSVIAAMLITAFGAAVLLLMKPILPGLELGASSGALSQACSGPGEQGLDFTKGASFLILGPFMKDISSPKEFYPTLIISLTAFQFGFLGAWIHFIGQVTRSYFMCDLTPNTFVNGSVRMVSASLLALVVSFILPTLFEDGPQSETFRRSLPVISFFFGYFPSRALLVIENFAGKWLGPLLGGKATYQSTPLSALPGVSYEHEVRLKREGIDNVENLSEASAIDFALRTGFGFKQLDHWIGQAWLRTRLGKDYENFERATGITSRQELKAFLDRWTPTPPHQRAQDQLKQGLDAEIHAKVEVICVNA